MENAKTLKEFSNENKERYTQIVEEFPIKVKVDKSWNGRYYTIDVPPMKLTFDTFYELGDNITDEMLKTTKGIVKRSKEVEEFTNDVFHFQYSYIDGSCTFTASTKKDVENWLKLYKKYVYVDN